MNPYVGLHEFVSWEACGIERGKFEEVKNPETGKKESIFKPSSTAQRWGVKHLGKTVASTELFSPEVFTQEVLELLDKNVIHKKFKLPDLTDPIDVLDDMDVEDPEEKTVSDEQAED